MTSTAIVLLSIFAACIVLGVGVVVGWAYATIKELRSQLDKANPRLSYDDLAAIENIKAHRARQKKDNELIDELLSALRDGRFRRQGD